MDKTRTYAWTPSHCIHARNVFSLLDLPPEDENFKRIKKHVDSCPACSKELENLKLKNLEVKVYIPTTIIDLEMKETIGREIEEIFKVFNLNAKAAVQRKIKGKIRALDTFGAEAIKNLTSRTMLKSYLVGILLFIVLKKFFP